MCLCGHVHANRENEIFANVLALFPQKEIERKRKKGKRKKEAEKEIKRGKGENGSKKEMETKRKALEGEKNFKFFTEVNKKLPSLGCDVAYSGEGVSAFYS